MIRPDSEAPGPDAAEAAHTPMPPSVQAGPMAHAILRVARLHRMLAGQLLRRVGLHPGQELVMMQLWDLGPQRQIDLVRLLGSDAATMTRTIKRLEHAGFVRRRPSPTDKRATIIEPTEASLALRHQVDEVWAELEECTAGQLPEERQAEAVQILEQIEASLSLAATRHAQETGGPTAPPEGQAGHM
ncbi:MarR family winged helix-turn-helix transcriptional regulator [Streptomyces sp. QHH-9511]|uniref:MarR family winged helix-turn-helix transcriptional regulator n=2 Tax=Streptomyces TaxID=1883 RepID=UPI001E4244A1|nr:MarR family winged helix-turn-helix transcriptional regulator [Streptomyces sp. QHH-9511]